VVGLAVIGVCLAACAAVAVAAAGEPLQDAEGAIDRLTLSPWLIVVPLAALCLLGMVGFTAVRAAGTARRVSRRSAWLTVIGFLLLVAALSRLDLDRATVDEPEPLEIAPPVAEAGGQSTAWPTWVVVGAGRQRSEAPFEHMSRVLAMLGVRPEPIERLTTLFAEARFSTHEITEDHRAAAERALAEARADLERVVAT
jgi:hypothetical protein